MLLMQMLVNIAERLCAAVYLIDDVGLEDVGQVQARRQLLRQGALACAAVAFQQQVAACVCILVYATMRIGYSCGALCYTSSRVKT